MGRSFPCSPFETTIKFCGLLSWNSVPLKSKQPQLLALQQPLILSQVSTPVSSPTMMSALATLLTVATLQFFDFLSLLSIQVLANTLHSFWNYPVLVDAFSSLPPPSQQRHFWSHQQKHSFISHTCQHPASFTLGPFSQNTVSKNHCIYCFTL